MPELPEVETVVRGLQKLIIDKVVVDAKFDWPKSFPNDPKSVESFLLGSKIVSVERRAKVIKIHLSTKYSLVIHLKMTGQLVYIGNREKGMGNGERFGAGHPNQSLTGRLPDKSTRVTFRFSDGTHLYFNDQRKFGWVKLIPTSEVDSLPFFVKVGPEPLDEELTKNEFIERLMLRKNSSIKAALLDQQVIAGIGNIYADESLWGAKIHPAQRVSEIPKIKLEKLLDEIRFVLKLSIEKGGSTDRNYVNAEGKRGSYIQFARVFRREKQPCPRCGTEIIKTRVAGRGTHTCPRCQKIPK